VGGFGKVYKGVHRKSGQVVAIKYVELTEFLKKANKIDEIYKETKILMNLNHKYIINIHFGFILLNNMVVVMDYCEGGELVDLVAEKQGLTEVETRTIIK
jgi:serine/threonine protein kinase